MGNRVFISGKISGMHHDTVRKNFAGVSRKLENLGYEVVNPTRICKKDWCWLLCMTVCLWNLMKCDTVYFMKNYTESKGAKIEHWLAEKLKKEIIYGSCR